MRLCKKAKLMVFTDRFLKLPTKIYSLDEANIVGEKNAETFCVDIHVNPLDIVTYREGHPGENDEEPYTVLEFRNREACMILLPVEEFVKRVNAFMQ